MPTTTNYGWTTPADTDLVKDGAAAIRTLGSSIDTSVKSLNAGTTAGDIDYYTSSTAKARIGIGTNGQVLTSNGSVPSWATPASGGMTLISTTTASALSSLSLSSIPATYKHLFLVFEGIYHSATGSWFDGRLNNDSGTNYAGIATGGSGANTTEQAQDNAANSLSLQNSMSINWSMFGRSITSGATDYAQAAQGSLWIYNYASTSAFKKFILNYSYRQSAATMYSMLQMQGVYKSTSAISSIDIYRGTGTSTFSNASNTSIRLYGVS